MLISYHPASGTDPRFFASGFRAVQVESMERIARCVTTCTWSPCVWHDGRRRQDHFERADLVALDFDGSMSLAEAMKIYCDSAHVIGLTRNHQREKGGRIADRFRVVLRLEQQITDVVTWRATAQYYNERWDADDQCHDGARLFFPCREIVSVNEDGEGWPAVGPKAGGGAARAPRIAKGELSAFVIAFLRTEMPFGMRNTSCHRVAKDLLRAGFDPNEVFDMIKRSPTYQGGEMPPSLADEISRAIGSAQRAVTAEAANV